MKALLIPVGSAGDVHPFVGLGLALRDRGHDVTVMTNGHFAGLVRRVGLGFVESGSAELYRSRLQDPDIWHPRRSMPAMAESLKPSIRHLYALVKEHAGDGETVVAAGTLAIGARIAQESLGLPLATVHLQPSLLRTVHQSPVLPGVYMPVGAPRWWKRLIYWLADVALVDRLLGPEINALRAELGLPPVRRLLAEWIHSPRRVIGLFPEWFAPPQPDWPAQVRLTGFPLYDERGVPAMPAEVERFLDAGDPPIIFTPGSGNLHGRAFFEASVEACERLGRRGLLLTRFAEQVPQSLPKTIRYFDFIPFSQVLPRSAALVHHGGIGTCAQGLAAGVPQLVMPMSFDQPDNAARLRRLGVATALSPRHYRGPAVAQALAELLGSLAVAARCREVARRFHGARPLDETCRLIEELHAVASPARAAAAR